MSVDNLEGKQIEFVQFIEKYFDNLEGKQKNETDLCEFRDCMQRQRI